MKIITLLEFVSAVEMMREYQKNDITKGRRLAKKWEDAVDGYITDILNWKQEQEQEAVETDPVPDIRQFYTLAEAGQVLRVSRQTINRLIRTGKLSIKRIGRRVIVPAENLTPDAICNIS